MNESKRGGHKTPSEIELTEFDGEMITESNDKKGLQKYSGHIASKYLEAYP